jgi:pimeloyl-ACP methyl ester carboxylesterase
VKGLGRVQRAHLDLTHNTDFSKRPDVLYCAFYQDGLIQSFQRMLVLQNTGYYSHKCNVIHAIEYYEDLRKDMVRNKRYGDVAYVDGYTNALYFLLADDELRKALPVYYVYGAKDQPVTLREFERLRRQAKTLHKSAYQWVLKGRKRMTELVPQHMPYFQ